MPWSAMNRLVLLLMIVGLLQGCLGARMAADPVGPDRPNVILILADDMGWGDLKSYNPQSRIPTPHLDRLAAEGLRLTDAHAPGSVCIPSRYGLLTGRYPFRNKRDFDRESLIEANRLTLPELFQQSGYATTMVGKWHQSFDGGGKQFNFKRPLKGGPVDRGFDRFFGMHASLDIPPYFYIEDRQTVKAPTSSVAASNTPGLSPIQGAFWREGAMAPGFDHTRVLSDFANHTLTELDSHHRNKPQQPLFLYLALTAPHTPWLPDAEFRGSSQAGLYGDFTAQVDHVVGLVLKKLDALDMSRNTLVVFTSDNGPVWYPSDAERHGHQATGPYRGMKGDAWEGGHRIPLLVRWPGRTPAGATSDQLVGYTDFMATSAELLGRKLPDTAAEDSFSFLHVLRGTEPTGKIRDHLIAQSSRGVLALRQGVWKYIPQLGSGGFSPPAKDSPVPGEPDVQLYRLDEDPGEKTSLARRHPEQTDRLGKLLKQIQEAPSSRNF